MAGGRLTLRGDVEEALEGVGVPSYVLDTSGIVRWINPAAERLLGDVRGLHYTAVVRARGIPTRPGVVLPEGARDRAGHGSNRLLSLNCR
jgi:hypothetical protein